MSLSGVQRTIGVKFTYDPLFSVFARRKRRGDLAFQEWRIAIQ
ncbi:MAG: hypothetical protein PWP57_1289 [Candidatus Atribacteria bacterium]|nr:hypothetical protein [Candidatus Atribacteria bacterium]